MSYLVLARKYRPQKFSEVVGQGTVVKTIVNALRLGKLTHALLFSGVKGTGKTTLARIVAKALNCTNLNTDDFEPCNQCSSCVEIMRGVHVDVLEIDAASNRGIDQIREIIDALKYAPARGRAKVYIIDEAHMLTKEASNALLKSLEEPPSHVYFILATTEPNRLLPTILSRCQRYEFKRFDFRLILQHLQRVCSHENYQIEPQALELIAKEAQGSLRDALSLLDQAMAYGVRTREDLWQSFGWHEESIFEDLAKALLQRDLKRTCELVQTLYEKGVDLISFTERLTYLFRELFLAKVFSKDISLDSAFEFRLLKNLLFLGEKEDILLLYQALYQGLESLKRSTYPQVQFELTLAKICEYKKFILVEKVLEKLPDSRIETLAIVKDDKSEVEAQSETKVEPKGRAEAQEGFLKDTILLQEKRQQDVQSKGEVKFPDKWKEFKSVVKKESPTIGALLEKISQPTERGDILVFTLEEDFPLLTSSYRDKLQDLVHHFFGKKVEFDVINRKKDLEEVKNRPEVKAVMELFSAKIAYIQPIEGE